jgi:hypothetical protein
MRRANPPWTDKILAKHWAALESRVGRALMPVQMTEPRGLSQLQEDIARMQKSADAGMTDPYWVNELYNAKVKLTKLQRQKPKGYREYGCGHYGCVMPTGTPGTVIKVTTDQTEASFVAAYLSMPKGQRPVGIVPYRRLIAIRSESHLKRPVFVLWRDEAQHLGVDGIRNWIKTGARDFERDYYSNSLKKSMHRLGNCLDAAREVRKRILNRPDAKAVLQEGIKRMDAVWQRGYPPRAGSSRADAVAWFLNAFRQNAEQMTTEPMGNYVGQGLYESFDAGLLLADVHLNNIGLPTGELLDEIGMTAIITDPGHAIALDDRYAGVQVEEL